jgi:hypothetical protein
MFAPAYRFPDDPPDPVIPARAASTTDPTADEPLPQRLARERAEAVAQISYVRATLAALRTHAQARLDLK